MMTAANFFSTVLMLWLLGGYAVRVCGFPNRGSIPHREDVKSSQPDQVSRECDDEDDCEQGSADDDGDRIPLRKLLPALEKESRPVDAFTGDVSNEKHDDTKYEVSMTTTSREKESRPVDAGDVSNKKHNGTKYEVSMTITSTEKESTPTDAFTADESSSNSKHAENDDVVYEIISRTYKKEDKKLSRGDCDDEDECGSAVDVFTNDGSGDVIIDGLSPSEKEKLSEKATNYEVISWSTVKKDKPAPVDAFTKDESSSNSSDKVDGDVKYEIISTSVSKVPSKNECDDEDECGSADEEDTGDGKGVTVSLPPAKEKDASSGKTTNFEVVSMTTEMKKDSTPIDAFQVKESSGDDVIYEVISRTMKKEDIVKSGQDCDDEDGCVDAFTNVGSGGGIKEPSTKMLDKESPEKTAFYEIISRTEMLEKDDRTPTDAFTGEESSKNGNEDVTYEVMSKSFPIGDMKNCDDEDDCGSRDALSNDDGSGDEDVLIKDPSSEKTNYEVTMMKEDGPFGKDCDDEDECGSAVDAFTNDELSPSKEKSGSREDTTNYEVMSWQTVREQPSTPHDTFDPKEVLPEDQKSLSKECDYDDEDCYLYNGGSGDGTFGARRVFSPPKYQGRDSFTAEHPDTTTYEIVSKTSRIGENLGPRVSVESSVRPLFRGTSFLELAPLGKDALDNVEVEMEILPLEDTGVLLYNGWVPNKIGDFISLSIQDGSAEFSFNCRSGAVKIRPLVLIKMNEWNSIKFFRSGRLGKLILNHDNAAIGFSPSPRSALTLQRNLLVGGIPETLRYEVKRNVGIDKGFTGYIRNLKIQGKPIDIQFDAIREKISKNPCTPSPCKNGGKCLENGADYSCSCKAQYRGRHCNEEIDLRPISFDRNSYLRFSQAALLNILQSKGGSVTFFVKTTQSNGLLLWEVEKLTKHSQSYAAVGLKVGFISLSFNLGNGKRQVYSNVPVNDGQWHNVTIVRKRTSYTLLIDEKFNMERRWNYFKNSSPLKSSVDLYIGGTPNIKSETQGLYKSWFNGCLKNFQINSKYLDFTRDKVASRGTGYCSDT